MHLVPLEEYCRRLKSDPQRGLSSAEAKLRLGREGPNLLVQRRRVPELLKFLHQLTNLFAILLWIGAGLCLWAEFLTPGQGNLAIAMRPGGQVFILDFLSSRMLHRAASGVEQSKGVRCGC